MTRCAWKERANTRCFADTVVSVVVLQSWKIGGYHRYLRDRVTATRGGGARCAVRSWQTCAIIITYIFPESMPARSAPRCTRAATLYSRTRVPSTRACTRNSARTRRNITPRISSCGSSADRERSLRLPLLFLLLSPRPAPRQTRVCWLTDKSFVILRDISEELYR